MANPKTVGRFYVDTTRQAAKNTASAQDAAARYMDELAGVGRTLFGVWSSSQQANLQTAFQLQNSLIEATGAVWNASARANLSLFEEWSKAVAESQAATARLAAAGMSMFDSPAPPRAG